LHRLWSFAPKVSAFYSNLHKPDQLFGVQSLELYPHGVLIPAFFALLWLSALSVRAWRELAAISFAIAQLTYLVFLPKSLDDEGSLWYPAARMTLTCPMTMWFLLAITAPVVIKRLRRPLQLQSHLGTLFGVGALAVVALVTTSATVRAVGFRDNMRRIVSTGFEPVFLELSRVSDIFALCHAAHRAAVAAGTNIVAFPTEGTANYACPALYPELLTIFPSYERRYWVLEELSTVPRDRMIVWGGKPELCTKPRYQSRYKSCKLLQADQGLDLTFDPQPPLRILHRLGYRIRAFGPGCIPQQPWNCRMWAQNYRRPRHRR
jgi:hypothetical protein